MIQYYDTPESLEELEPIRQAFPFFQSFLLSIDNMPKEEQLALYRAIAVYGVYGKKTTLKGFAKSLFIQIQSSLDGSYRRSTTNSNNGKKGGAPIGNQNARKNNRKTTEKQPKNNQPYSKNIEDKNIEDENIEDENIEDENIEDDTTNIPTTTTREENSDNWDMKYQETIQYKYLNQFFDESNGIIIKNIMTNLQERNPNIKTEKDVKEMAKGIISEWLMTHTQHNSYTEFAIHMRNHLVKYAKESYIHEMETKAAIRKRNKYL